LRIREAYPGIDGRLIGKVQLRIGLAQARLRHNEEAEAAFKVAVERLDKPPIDQQLAVALFELTKIYTSTDRPRLLRQRAVPSACIPPSRAQAGLPSRRPGDFSVQHSCFEASASSTRETTPEPSRRWSRACRCLILL